MCSYLYDELSAIKSFLLGVAKVKYSKTINTFMHKTILKNKFRETKAQNVVELTILVAASMLALTAIFTIYSNQFGVLINFNDDYTARTSVRAVVDAANTLYYAGPGSEIKILVEMPSSVIYAQSSISGKTVYLKMADGSDVLDVADVNISGEWLEDERYYMLLRYDGNVVSILTQPYSVVGGTAFLITDITDINSDLNFIITNEYETQLDFSLEMFFESVDTNIGLSFENDSNTFYFELLPNESKVVYFELQGPNDVCNENASGYFNIITTGQDYDFNKSFFVSVEYDLNSC
jgi:hypothetical protein